MNSTKKLDAHFPWKWLNQSKLTLCFALSLGLTVSTYTAARGDDDSDIQKYTREIQDSISRISTAQSPDSRKCYCDSAGLYYSLRADNYLNKKNYSQAISDLRSALRYCPAGGCLGDSPGTYQTKIADVYIKSGDTKTALAELDRFIANASGDAQAYMILKRAEILDSNCEYDKALRDYTQLTYSKNLQAIIRRGSLYKKLGRKEDAITDYQNYLNTCKSDDCWLSIVSGYLVSLLEETGRDDEALKTLNNLVRLKPDSVYNRASYFEQHMRLADALDDRNEAVSLARRELNAADSNEKSWKKRSLCSSLEYRARLCKKMGKMEQASADYAELIQTEPTYTNYRTRCDFFKATEKWEEALSDLNQMVKLDPIAGLQARAAFYDERNKHELALDDYNQAIKQCQAQFDQADEKNKYDSLRTWISALGSRISSLKSDSGPSSSLPDLSEVVRLRQKSLDYADNNNRKADATNYLSDSYVNRADVLGSLHKDEESIADLDEAVRIMQKLISQLASEPNSSIEGSWTTYRLKEALSARANFRLAHKDFESGLADMNALIAADKTRITARADYYEKAGKLDLAEADFRANIDATKQLFANPPKAKNSWENPKESAKNNYKSALSSLSQFYDRTGKLDKAVDVLNDVLAITPEDLDTNYEKAKLFVKLNQTERAMAAFTEVADFKTTSDYNYQKIGEALLYLKRYDQAVSALSRYLGASDSGEARLLRAKAYKGLNNSAKAQEDLNIALRQLSKTKDQSDNDKRLIASVQSELKSMGVRVPIAHGRAPASSPIVRTDSKPAPASSNNQPIRDKWALVIGISKFQNPSYNLKYAAKDAQDFYNYLVHEAGFKPDHVCLLLNEKATRENIMTAFGTKFLPSVSEPGDLVVIFISTHGTPANKDNAGRNYIVAYNTDATNLYPTGVDMDDLYGRIKDGVNTDRALIVMDTCFSGAGLPGAKSLGDGANFDVNQIAQGCGRLVITSSSNNERSYESANTANGVFTKYFLQSLRQSGGKVDVKKAFENARDKVEWEVQNAFNKSQTPQLGGEWEGKELILSAPATSPRAVFSVPFSQSPAPGSVAAPGTSSTAQAHKHPNSTSHSASIKGKPPKK